jgi:hypothetical protein
MPCSNCKYWNETGETTVRHMDIHITNLVGNCSSTDVHDAIIKTDQDEDILAITVIMGVTTSVTTKDYFECKYYETKKLDSL